jgi:hypothetical protein
MWQERRGFYLIYINGWNRVAAFVAYAVAVHWQHP